MKIHQYAVITLLIISCGLVAHFRIPATQTPEKDLGHLAADFIAILQQPEPASIDQTTIANIAQEALQDVEKLKSGQVTNLHDRLSVFETIRDFTNVTDPQSDDFRTYLAALQKKDLLLKALQDKINTLVAQNKKTGSIDPILTNIQNTIQKAIDSAKSSHDTLERLNLQIKEFTREFEQAVLTSIGTISDYDHIKVILSDPRIPRAEKLKTVTDYTNNMSWLKSLKKVKDYAKEVQSTLSDFATYASVELNALAVLKELCAQSTATALSAADIASLTHASANTVALAQHIQTIRHQFKTNLLVTQAYLMAYIKELLSAVIEREKELAKTWFDSFMESTEHAFKEVGDAMVWFVEKIYDSTVGYIRDQLHAAAAQLYSIADALASLPKTIQEQAEDVLGSKTKGKVSMSEQLTDGAHAVAENISKIREQLAKLPQQKKALAAQLSSAPKKVTQSLKNDLLGYTDSKTGTVHTGAIDDVMLALQELVGPHDSCSTGFLCIIKDSLNTSAKVAADGQAKIQNNIDLLDTNINHPTFKSNGYSEPLPDRLKRVASMLNQ